jgi:hypothetical protein
MTNALMLNYEGPGVYSPYISNSMFINSKNGVLYVDYAVPGDNGQWNGNNVPLGSDGLYGNCIISGLVLTDCKIYLSLDKLNGDTCTIIPNQNEYNPGIITDPSFQPYQQNSSKGNVPKVFCQVPNNTCVSSHSVKTLLNQPHNFSCIQFYNPPISKLNKLDIQWYNEDGELLRILDHCFTLRIHYFQKRMDGTQFSYPIP